MSSGPPTDSPPSRKESGEGGKNKVDRNRPAQQIYRPPGSRLSGDSPASPPPPPSDEKPVAAAARSRKGKEIRPPPKEKTSRPSKAAGPQKQPVTGKTNKVQPTNGNGQLEAPKETPQHESKRGGKPRFTGSSFSNSHLRNNGNVTQTPATAQPPPEPKPILKNSPSAGELNPKAPVFEPPSQPQPLFPSAPTNGAKTPPRRGQSPGPAPGTEGGAAKPRLPPRRQNSFIRLEAGTAKVKGPPLPRDPAEVKRMFAALDLPASPFLDDFLGGNCESAELGPPTAQLLVQAAIEEGRSSKAVAKLCGVIVELGSGVAFARGLVAACAQYYECRDKLRTEHFKFWLAFLNLTSDLYASLGSAWSGELVEILFGVFDFLLSEPTLELLKIEELECLISGLMGTGYELERECPERLTALRHRIRDAFIAATEPWARKMILLLVELSASGWRLPNEANEYYFQTVAASS